MTRVKICLNAVEGGRATLSRSIFVVVGVCPRSLLVKKDTPTSWKTFEVKSWVRWPDRKART